MFVYFVMRSQRLHCNKCEGWHSQYEHYRVHVHGVYLNKETAKKVAAQRGKNNGKHFIQGFKVKDADEVIGTLTAGFILQPLGLQVVDPNVKFEESNRDNWPEVASRVKSLLTLPDYADFYKYIGQAYIEKGCTKVCDLVWGSAIWALIDYPAHATPQEKALYTRQWNAVKPKEAL